MARHEGDDFLEDERLAQEYTDAQYARLLRPTRSTHEVRVTYTIYALVDPLTHLVLYVGKTADMDQRYRRHCSGKDQGTGPWVRSLPQPPILVILETGPEEKVTATAVRKSTKAETKWLKRFRRTVLNTNTRDNSPTTWDFLVNADELKAS